LAIFSMRSLSLSSTRTVMVALLMMLHPLCNTLYIIANKEVNICRHILAKAAILADIEMLRSTNENYAELW
ncbi:MAG: hypothetical protein M0Z67_00005, partial [Nitrospiraceae bacterium]|nr:hypothetical protein [Nitrospiraceae bacterium]